VCTAAQDRCSSTRAQLWFFRPWRRLLPRLSRPDIRQNSEPSANQSEGQNRDQALVIGEMIGAIVTDQVVRSHDGKKGKNQTRNFQQARVRGFEYGDNQVLPRHEYCPAQPGAALDVRLDRGDLRHCGYCSPEILGHSKDAYWKTPTRKTAYWTPTGKRLLEKAYWKDASFENVTAGEGYLEAPSEKRVAETRFLRNRALGEAVLPPSRETAGP